MGDGLKMVAGNKLEAFLYRMTNTPLKGVALGTGVTSVIQSSSATTVMVIGFVNSGMMKLKQAIGIIMGANIGTSITGWILCLSYIDGKNGIAKILSTATISAVVAIIGIILRMACKRSVHKNIGNIMLGFAILMTGMQMMSQGLENAAGDKMKQILEKLTSNRLLGVLVGAVITAVIQSSSATTVMVVGFVNSGMMTLTQAIWIIMGANIGTTITGQLIALDVGVLAPFIAFVGVAILVFLKNERIHYIGNIVAGLGILFIGMDMMSSSMAPLSESQEFVGLLTRFENPILGILAGMIFTAIIQSSSASVGILQALAASGIVTLNSAAFILFGQNIGTCITALLASVGANRNAKRTTIVHFTFNVIGTFLFTILCVVTPLIGWLQTVTPTNVPGQIANLHTLFNIVTTILLLPFGEVLAKISQKILPVNEKDDITQGVLPRMQLNVRDTLGQLSLIHI